MLEICSSHNRQVLLLWHHRRRQRLLFQTELWHLHCVKHIESVTSWTLWTLDVLQTNIQRSPKILQCVCLQSSLFHSIHLILKVLTRSQLVNLFADILSARKDKRQQVDNRWFWLVRRHVRTLPQPLRPPGCVCPSDVHVGHFQCPASMSSSRFLFGRSSLVWFETGPRPQTDGSYRNWSSDSLSSSDHLHQSVLSLSSFSLSILQIINSNHIEGYEGAFCQWQTLIVYQEEGVWHSRSSKVLKLAS